MPFYYEYKKVIPLNFSASLSYYLFLALVPSLLLVNLFTSFLFNNYGIIEEVIKLILPSSSSEEIIEFIYINEVKFNSSLIIILLSINIISNGMRNLCKSMDIIFEIKSTDHLKIKSILLSILLIILEGSLLYLASFIDDYLLIFKYLRFIILFVVILLCFIFMYKFLPSRPLKIKETISLSIIGSFFISLLILGFNIFIDYYSKMEIYYGSFSIIVSILILFKLISDIIAFVFYLQYKKYKKSSLLL